ncbi:MAG: KilA-N domain-containing protein [Methylovulum sp.]
MTSKSKYEIVGINNIEVLADVSMLQKTDEMFFNATLIAKQFGKKPKEWLDSKQGTEYIGVILKAENFHFENLVRTTQGGKYKGTWLHKKLTLPFARWLSVKFEYELDKWVDSRIEEEHQRQQHRLGLKTGFLPLTNAIQAAHAEPEFYHFSNECDLINRFVTGMTAKKFKQVRGVENVRDALTAAESQLMDKLQRQNTSLIELGFSYEERKHLLIKYADKPLGAIE